jgi:hypothetical protein
MRPQRDDDGVVAGRGLELEVEPDAELLAQRVAHGPVDAAAERRMDDQLHAVGVVEEALHHQVGRGRHDPEHRPAGSQVGDDQRRGVALDAAALDQPAGGACGIVALEEAVDARTQRRDLLGQLHGPRRGLARPERHRRRGVAGIGDTDLAPGDPPDPPTVGAQQEDVACGGLGGPVLGDGADEGLVGFGDDPHVVDLGDGARRR